MRGQIGTAMAAKKILCLQICSRRLGAEESHHGVDVAHCIDRRRCVCGGDWTCIGSDLVTGPCSGRGWIVPHTLRIGAASIGGLA